MWVNAIWFWTRGFVRVNRNYVLTEYVLNENDCIVILQILTVSTLREVWYNLNFNVSYLMLSLHTKHLLVFFPTWIDSTLSCSFSFCAVGWSSLVWACTFLSTGQVHGHGVWLPWQPGRRYYYHVWVRHAKSNAVERFIIESGNRLYQRVKTFAFCSFLALIVKGKEKFACVGGLCVGVSHHS